MKTHTVTTYSLSELSEDARNRAYQAYVREASQWDLPWLDEIVRSFHAAADAMGIRLTDWQIGEDGARVRVGAIPDGVDDMTPGRLWSWIDKRLRPLCQRPPLAKRLETWRKYRRTWSPCDLRRTGYCADYDMTRTALDGARSGMDLRSIIYAMADECAKLLEAERDYLLSEEEFQAHWATMEFLEDGSIYH
jgi:hypothetical protein